MKNIPFKNHWMTLAVLFLICTMCCSAEDKASVNYKMNLALVSMFRDEADYLREWIEYHHMLGVERFYLYNNLSEDHYEEVLAPYVKKGLVELIDWPYEASCESEFNQMQRDVYNNAIDKTRGKAKWLAIVDTDEYIVPVKAKTIVEFLKPFEKKKAIGGICGIWIFFGTSGVEKVPPDQLMIELLTLNGGATASGNLSAIWNSGLYKSIVRPDRVVSCVSPHYCIYKKGYHHDMAGWDLVQINHYWTRDEDFLHRVKIPRRAFWGSPAEVTLSWSAAMNQNNNFSNTILRFVPQLKKEMGQKKLD